MNTPSPFRLQRVRVLCWLLLALLLGLSGGRSFAQTVYVDQIAAGLYHTLVVKSDGTVWAWGWNDAGELGNNTIPLSYVPVQVSGLSGVIAVAAGQEHSLALKSDGTVWTWGENGWGQLGNNSTTTSGTPAQVSGLTDVIAITGGGDFSAALKSDGTVWTWGDNANGQLGNNSTTRSLVPVQVSGLANVVSIAAGYDFCVAVLSDGTMWSWGSNIFGQLGNNSTTRSLVPVQVTGLTDMTVAAAGYDSASGLKNDGTLWTWGDNQAGELGTFSTASRSLVPAQIGWPTNFAAMSSGGGAMHTLAITSDGTLWSWGGNSYGQLGDTSGYSRSYPYPVWTNWAMIAVAAGGRHSLAVTSSGNILGWGYDMDGELGNDRSYSVSTPVQIPNLGGWYGGYGVVGASTGSFHSLAVTSDGSVWSWGMNEWGQLGDWVGAPRMTPYQISPYYFSAPAVAVSAGGLHSLALTRDGNVWGWGDNGGGELGQPFAPGSSISLGPVQVPGLTDMKAVAAGYFFSAALKNDGTVYTFGSNWYGNLGNNSTTSSNVPAQVPGLTDVAAISVEADSDYVLALKNDGTVWAWGQNNTGQLGNNTTTDSHVPIQVSGVTGVVAIAAGLQTSYALKSDGTVWAWGYGGGGELGNNSTADSHVPIQVPGLTGVAKISAGGFHAVALKNDGSLWTWGENWSGQLGNGTLTDSWVPIQITTVTGIKAIACGDETTLAVKEDGTVASWGDSTFGSVGVGWGYAHADAKVVFGLNLVHPAPQVAFTTPAPNGSMTSPMGQYAQMQFSTTPSDTSVNEVQLWAQGVYLGSTYGSSTFYWQPPTYGDFSLSLVAVDVNGGTSVPSVPIILHVPLDSDGNGIGDWWELKYFNTVGVTASALAPSGNGLTLLQSYQQGLDPYDYYKGVNPNIATVGSTLASAPMGTNVKQPFTALVTDQLGNPLVNAPVSASFLSGSGLVSPTGDDGTWTYGLTLYTDADGKVSFYVGAASWSLKGLNKVSVSAGPVLPQPAAYFDVVVTPPFGVSVSDYYSQVIKHDGTAWEWGNWDLIWGFQQDNPTPVQVPGLSNVISASSSKWTEIAVDQDEHAFVWGNVAPGDPLSGIFEPLRVYALPGVVAGAAGEMHFLTLANDGTVWAWGANDNGELGDTTTAYSATPVQAAGLANATAIAAGSYHSVALKDDGTVWVWGMNNVGQLGIGSIIDASSPTQVSGLFNIQSVSAGNYHTAALDQYGNLWTWGGSGPTSPALVSGLTNVVAIAAGNYRTLAVTYDGKVWDVSTDPAVAPVQVSGLANIAVVATGNTHSLAVTNSGGIYAWGDNTSAELGVNFTNDGSWPTTNKTPAQLRYLTGATMAQAGEFFSVALRSDGTVWGWGDNNSAELGTYSGTSALEPMPIPGIKDVASLSCGRSCVAVVKKDGTIWAWGLDPNAAFYINTPGYPYYAYIYSVTPVQMSGMTGVVAASVGDGHGMALKGDGTVWTWGSNYGGMAGTGTTTSSYWAPVQVPGITTAKAIATGGTYDLVLKNDGTVWGWGAGWQGVLGNNSQADQHSPVQVSGLTNVVAISACGSHSLAVKSDGTVWAWGSNPVGEIGDGTTTERDVPVQVLGLTNVVAVVAGGDHSMALKADGTVWAWGYNNLSQLGDGTTNNSLVPIQVAGLEEIKSIGTGWSNTSYAVKQDGTVISWGDSTYGQVGAGFTQFATGVQPVLGFNLLDAAPSVAFSDPAGGTSSGMTLAAGQLLQYTTTLPNAAASEVQLWSNGQLLGTSQTTIGGLGNYSFGTPSTGAGGIFWRPTTYGEFDLTLVVVDQSGAYSARSTPVHIHVAYDSDANGLPDWWELKYFGYIGVDPMSQPDGSGLTVADMWALGTYPLDPNRALPPASSGDTNPPVIQLTKPAGATLGP